MTNSTSKLRDLELIIKSIPDPIFIFNKEQILIKSYISDNKKVSFYNTDFLNKNVADFFPPEISNLFKKSINNTFLSQETQTIDFSFQTEKLKEYFEVDFTLIDKDRVLALIKNLTKNKITEDSFLQSEINFKKTQSIAHIGSWSWNIEKNEFLWSDEVYRIFGAKTGEFKVSFDILKQYIHPDDYDSYIRVIKYVIEDKVSYKTEYRIIQKNKKIRYIEERGQVKVDSSGKTILVNGTIQNITLRKLAEKTKKENELKIQSMFIAAPTGSGFTKDRIITEVNHRLCEITGYNKEELLNKNTYFLYSSIKEYEEAGNQILKQIKNKKAVSVETKWTKKTGEIIDVLINSSPIDRNNLSKGNTFSILDITENKKNQDELKRAIDIINLSPVVVFQWENKNNWPVKYVSENVKDIFGYTSSEFCSGKPFYSKVIHPDDLERVAGEAPYNKRDCKGVTYQTYRIITKSGKVKWIDERTVDFRTDNKEKTHCQGIVVDITEQVNTKNELFESEKKYRILTETAKDAIIRFDKKGTISMWNNAAVKIFGYTLKEAIGKKINDFFELDEFDNSLQSDLQSFFEKAKYPQMSDIIELIGIRKNEKKFPVELTISSMISDDSWLATGIIRDVTKRKETQEALRENEEKYRTLFENSFDIIYSIDTRGKYKFVNPMWHKTLGYTKEELKDLKLTDVIHIETLDHAKYFIERALRGAEVKGLELIYVTKRREKIYVEENITPIFKNNKVVELQAFIRNISERKLADKELEKHRTNLEELVKSRTNSLEESNQELIDISQKYIKLSNNLGESEEKLQKSLKKEKELNELKSRFISTTSHEFRTPLASINFSAGFLRKYIDRIEKDEMKQNLVKIENQVKHMTNLLDDILLIERSQSDKMQIKPEEQDLYDFLLPIIDETYIATMKTHEFRVNKISGNCKIYIDVKAGRKIFLNLFTNAVKFSPEKKYIDVNCSCTNKSTKIEIIDYGIGISKKEIGSVFEPFHRSENAESIPGTGLGLAIVKESIEKHKGTIDIKSKSGKGTKFTIILPSKQKK